MTKRKSRSKPCTSLRQAARAIGCTEGAMRKWRKRHDWPFGQTQPWDVVAIEQWRQNTLTKPPNSGRATAKPPPATSGIPDGGGDLHRASVAYKLERTLLIRQDRLEREGKMHSVADCKRLRMQRIGAVRAGLLDLARSLPPRLAGRKTAKMAEIIEEAVYAILNEFAGTDE